MQDVMTICTCELCQPNLGQVSPALDSFLRDRIQQKEASVLEAAHRRKVEASRPLQPARDGVVLSAN